MKKNHLFPISETFVSIQGEGNYVGRRSLFIRFQYCNLTCSWCDTKYTWFKKSGNHEWFSAESIKERIKKSKVRHVILTGGEPTLFDLSKLFLENIQFHVESNGTLIPTESILVKLKDGTEIKREAMKKKTIKQFNWVISPKLSNSAQSIEKNAMTYWSSWSKNFHCIFKCIIKNGQDIKEVEDFIKQFQIPKEKVFLALEGFTRESQLQNRLVDEILDKGFHYSPRLHVLLWNRQREK